MTGLAVAAAMIVLAACAGFLVYADAAIDRVSELREAQLMRHAMADQLDDLKEDVQAEGNWTEAYERIALRYDPAWTHLNFGLNFYDVRKHDFTLIFDGDGRLIYVSIYGRMAQPAANEAFADAFRPMVDATRAQAARILRADPGAEGPPRQAASAASVRAGDRIYFAAAATIGPERGYRGRMSGKPDPVVVSIREAGPGFLKGAEAKFGLSSPHIVLGRATTPTSQPMTDVNGRTIASIDWRPSTPGWKIVTGARWRVLGLGLAAVFAVSLLVLRLRRLAQEVAIARDRAQAGDRAKSDFIANISHEIRTPLNGVLGMAQVMDAHPLPAEQKARLTVIRESGQALLALLNDVLDFSKIEAGKLEIVEDVFDAAGLTREVAAAFEGMAATKNVALRVEVAPDAEGGWVGDALRIRQMLSNLASNAIKFTAEGAVTLALRAEADGLRFTVSDTGIGLDESQASRLFAKFAQADSSTTRKYGGSGLGLTIIQGLLALMNGRIEVAGSPGEGASFALVLPLRRSGAPVPAEDPQTADDGGEEVAAASLRILAAEDNPTNQFVLKALLEPLTVDLTVVSDGAEAADAFATSPYDIILMDVQMPRMDGLEATAAIRAIEAERGLRRTPIIALTANAMRHQVETYLAADMDGHVAKPIDAAELYRALESFLRGDEAAEAA